MTETPTNGDLQLKRFERRHASKVVEWVASASELRWLAPSTQPPLTADKVANWPKKNGMAFSLFHVDESDPIGYGELNPMRGDSSQMWLGHIIIRPDERGKGIGSAFVRLQVAYAFEQLAAKRVALIVFPDNIAAVQCYRRIGFTPAGPEYHRFGKNGPKERLLRFEIHAYRAGDFRGLGNSRACSAKLAERTEHPAAPRGPCA